MVRATPRFFARREYVLFLVGIGAIGLHVLDDNFLQPSPGTSAGDHLVSGLVPLGMIVLAATVYPRLRAGFRAVIALTLGFLAVVGGASEAGYYTVKVGASGDDYTGLLMIPAGALLIAVGFWTLWRTRRLDESRRRRYPRRLLIAVVGFASSSRSCSRSPFPTCTRTRRGRLFPRPSLGRPTMTSPSPPATASSSPAGTSPRRTVRP